MGPKLRKKTYEDGCCEDEQREEYEVEEDVGEE